MKEFVAKFRARYDGETPDAHGRPRLRLGGGAGRRDQAGRHDRAAAALRDALAATRDYPGVTGPTTMDPERNATKAAVIITVKDGHFKFVAERRPLSGPPGALCPSSSSSS